MKYIFLVVVVGFEEVKEPPPGIDERLVQSVGAVCSVLCGLRLAWLKWPQWANKKLRRRFGAARRQRLIFGEKKRPAWRRSSALSPGVVLREFLRRVGLDSCDAVARRIFYFPVCFPRALAPLHHPGMATSHPVCQGRRRRRRTSSLSFSLLFEDDGVCCLVLYLVTEIIYNIIRQLRRKHLTAALVYRHFITQRDSLTMQNLKRFVLLLSLSLSDGMYNIKADGQRVSGRLSYSGVGKKGICTERGMSHTTLF